MRSAASIAWTTVAAASAKCFSCAGPKSYALKGDSTLEASGSRSALGRPGRQLSRISHAEPQGLRNQHASELGGVVLGDEVTVTLEIEALESA
jgi:hypothetical protein